MIGTIFVLIAVFGCAAHQYLKGKLVGAFAFLVIAICADVVAFNYFEQLASIAIEKEIIVPWTQGASFLLLFIVSFGILAAIGGRLIPKDVDFGNAVNSAGRIVCGLLLGLVLSGTVLTAAALSPLPAGYPYERFSQGKFDSAKGVLLNADGVVSGLFGVVSRGSFSGEKSFALLHSDFIDQIHRNRHKIDRTGLLAGSKAIQIPAKAGLWRQDGILKISGDKQNLQTRPGYELMIVRVGFGSGDISKGGAMNKGSITFTPSQLRLICRSKVDKAKMLGGGGKNVYPIGYIKTDGVIRLLKPDSVIRVTGADFKDGSRWVDFVFYVPESLVPAVAEFKQNSIAMVPGAVSGDKIPQAVAFVPVSACAKDSAMVKPAGSTIHGLELTAGTSLLSGLEFEIGSIEEFQQAQSITSLMQPVLDETLAKIRCVRARLLIAEDSKGKKTVKAEQLNDFLQKRKDYKLLALKCNNPAVGSAISSDSLPRLVELSGVVHSPVGIIATGPVSERSVYEVDYCAITKDKIEGGLVIGPDGAVAEAFPDSIWLTQEVEKVEQFYVLYLIPTDRIIISVRTSEPEIETEFEKTEGFIVK